MLLVYAAAWSARYIVLWSKRQQRMTSYRARVQLGSLDLIPIVYAMMEMPQHLFCLGWLACLVMCKWWTIEAGPDL